MAIKLSASQKDEIRRLTQQANRRIASYLKTYQKAGYNVIPKEVVPGFDIQAKKQFQTSKYALSRSVKFETQEDYERHIKKLQRFDKDYKGADKALTQKEYTKLNRVKMLKGLETAGFDVSEDNLARINKMSLIDQKRFWAEFTKRAIRMQAEYSSDQVFELVMHDMFSIDLNKVMEKSMGG